MNVVKILEKSGRIELADLASLFLPKIWEEEEEIEDDEEDDGCDAHARER